MRKGIQMCMWTKLFRYRNLMLGFSIKKWMEMYHQEGNHGEEE